MGFVRDDVVVVHTSWADYGPDEGYLELRKNMRIIVEYVGKVDEAGWLFGYDRNDSQGFHGWFPEGHVTLLPKMPPPAPKPKPKPPPPKAMPVASTTTQVANPGPHHQQSIPVDTTAHAAPAARRDAVATPAASQLAASAPQVAEQASRAHRPVDVSGPATKVQAASSVPSKASVAPSVQAAPVLQAVAASWPPPPAAIHLADRALPPPPPGRPPAPLPPPTGPPPATAAKATGIVPPAATALKTSVVGPPPTAELKAAVTVAPPTAIVESGGNCSVSGHASLDEECDDDAMLPPPGFDLPASRRELRDEVARAENDGAQLPMAQLRDDLLKLVSRRRVVVVDAATGSGKSTMVPLYLVGQCLELGRSCRIVVTQPRRLAAKGLAKRVSSQAGAAVGSLAGYRVGSDKQDYGAPIVYVTAGHLLEALVHNPSHLNSFSHIVLDEVHERFVEADFLMALLRLSLSRPETMAVRIVVMSATLQKTLGEFFKPILLPKPEKAFPGRISLPSGSPYQVIDYNWDDIKANWPTIFVPGAKEPDFNELKPSRAKQQQLNSKRRSDQLTRFCKEMAPWCARLLCALRKRGTRVGLVFLPGLDQMREVEDNLNQENARMSSYGTLEIFLMHSALDEETYRDALNPMPDNHHGWRVVLATNIAESSLTVPGVDAVIDFGLHRVNVYDDEARMSMLATEWCSNASSKQRRGRTGRTTDGVYIQLIAPVVLKELRDFDESGVERSPLTRATLEAAHLAELFNSRPAVRAGLPVTAPCTAVDKGGKRIAPEGATERRVAGYWHGPGEGWRMGSNRMAGEDCTTAFPEKELTPLPVDAYHMLSLLPAPPNNDRIQAALTELHELGALTSQDTPSVLGTAYLKIPLDIPLARLAIMSWVLGQPVDGAVLASALSLSPSCDVFRVPFNTKNELNAHDLRAFRETIEVRRQFDGGSLSEPLTIRAIFFDWLSQGGSCNGRRGGTLGRRPWTTWGKHVNERMWIQFVEKTIDIMASLIRLSPPDRPEMKSLQEVLSCMQGRSRLAPEELRMLQHVPLRKLSALLTWSLAPGGFFAVGQTPALYNEGGSYSRFKNVVKRRGGTTMDRNATLYWPKIKYDEVKEIITLALELRPRFLESGADQIYLGFKAEEYCETSLTPDCEFLVRICAPFNGRETILSCSKTRVKCPRPPRHPCTLNWYMPRRDGTGIIEVRANWKTQAETLLHMPRQGDTRVPCRPKRFMVASGAEYHSSAGRRAVFLRGVSVLPSEDGGRSALLWLLAAGIPRESEFVAMAAPDRSCTPGEFEVRALRMWRRTLWLPRDDPLTSFDLRGVNSFRNALLDLQCRRPHRLAGTWTVKDKDTERLLECIDECTRTGGTRECLLVSGGSQDFMMLGEIGGQQWSIKTPDTEAGNSELVGGTCKEVDGCLHWSDGSVWTRSSSTDTPVLSALGLPAVRKMRDAAEHIFSITADDRGEARSSRWVARLVPFRTTSRSAESRSTFLQPFDLSAVENRVDLFATKLRPNDMDSDDEDLDCDDVSDYEEDGDSGDDEDDDDTVDVSQEGINDEYLWRLAEHNEWTPAESRNLLFVETSIALPRTAMCVECEQDGKQFSRSQLSKHPDERRCKDCIQKAASVAYKPSALFGGPKVSTVVLQQSMALPAGVGAALSGAGGGVAVCSMCRLQLTKQNCSASQRQKPPSKRKCVRCMQSAH